MSFLVDRTKYAVAAALPTGSATGVEHGTTRTFESDSNGSGSSSSSNGSSPDNIECALACRHCGSTALTTDWKAGDVICTNCGIVAEEHIRDISAEWREYQDDPDSSRAGGVQRCGMVANDERRWVGGLEPTTLSSQPFGGPLLTGRSTTIMAPVRQPAATQQAASFSNSMMVRPTSMIQQLRRVQSRIEYLMKKGESSKIKDAELARKVMEKRRLEKKRAKEGGEEEEEEAALPPSLVASHDDDLEASILSPKSNKWCLESALILYGANNEAHSDETASKQKAMEYKREELSKRLSTADKDALSDVFLLYTIIHGACQRLRLPIHIVRGAVSLCCGYASKMNGFRVRGISSRGNTKCNIASGDGSDSARKIKNKKAEEKFFSKVQQIGALSAASISITASQSHESRGFPLILQGVKDQCKRKLNVASPVVGGGDDDDELITEKSCAKAMEQLNFVISEETPSMKNLDEESSVSAKPSIVQSDPSASTNNEILAIPEAVKLVPHVAEELSLTTEATIMIQRLAFILSKEHSSRGRRGLMNKPAIICASSTLLICNAGTVMRRLAEQATTVQTEVSKSRKENGSSKKRKKDDLSSVSRKRSKQSMKSSSDCWKDPTKESESSQESWSEWLRQQDWKRDFSRISKVSGIPSKQIFRFYKDILFPKRSNMLVEAFEQGKADLANVASSSVHMLETIASAAPLMRLEKPSNL